MIKAFTIASITDMVSRCVLFVCVTYAAVHFENWRIMLLCLFGLLFSHGYRVETGRKEDEE